MASGTPVVTSNVSSLPEAVGDAAMLVNPENVFDIARGIRDVLVDHACEHALIARGKSKPRASVGSVPRARFSKSTRKWGKHDGMQGRTGALTAV
jgi:glycosyltransferase involved in cell wall biosynthesis